MSAAPVSSCPSAETLAEYCERRLPGLVFRVVEEHVLRCSDCYAVLGTVIESFDDIEPARRRSKRQRRFLAAAAVLRSVYVNKTQSLVKVVGDLQCRAWRGRLSCCPGYIPPADGSGDSSLDRVRLMRAAAVYEARAKRNGSAKALHESAIANLCVGAIDRAAEQLVIAVKTDGRARTIKEAIARSQDFALLTDLAVVMELRMTRGGSVADRNIACIAAERAFTLERSPETRWNRALLIERTSGREAARVAWQEYLEADSNSEWAFEAQAHLADREQH